MRPSLPRSLPRPRLRWLALALVVLVVAAFAGSRMGGPALDDPGGLASDGAAAGSGEEAEQERAASAADVTGPAQDMARPVAGLGGIDDADPGRRLIREGSVTVAYPDSFDAAYGAVAGLADRLGGGVLDVGSRTDAEDVVRGTVTVEVPVEEYDALLDGVADVGEILRRDVRTEDVTETYTDLESRLRHLERTEQFFLDLFDDAETVDDAITIRDRLDSVQQRIEEIEGRLTRIDERTRMSRLTVELVPEGDELDGAPTVAAGFGDYWDDAREAFVSVTGTIMVLVVGAAPLLLAGGVALAVVVVAVRAWRSGGPAGTAPAHAAGPE